MPKLLDREPTQEMLKAIASSDCATSNYKRMFQAAYDAAPDVKQEPFGYVREIRPMEWKFSKTTSWGPEVWKPVFTFPIDAQAEIAKRDARIAELETHINTLAREQAAEISRLKALVEKCKEVLEDSHQNINQERGFASEIKHDIEQALAAIKEEGL